jgi:hypothetical protein
MATVGFSTFLGTTFAKRKGKTKRALILGGGQLLT